MDVRKQHADEYAALTPTEKEAIVAEHDLRKAHSAPSTRVTARSRVQDFAHTYQQISDLASPQFGSCQATANTLTIDQMQALSTRIGAHGFFCLVQASPHYNTSPKWYYTHEGIEDYLKFVVRRRWDPRLVGTQLEAFAISGCDINREYIPLLRIR